MFINSTNVQLNLQFSSATTSLIIRHKPKIEDVMARHEATCFELSFRSFATDYFGLRPRNDVADWAVFLFFIRQPAWSGYAGCVGDWFALWFFLRAALCP
jgi:hypothetical protein